MLDVWEELVPRAGRAFDVAWGSQSGTACPTLNVANGDGHPDLLRLYSEYFERDLKSASRSVDDD